MNLHAIVTSFWKISEAVKRQGQCKNKQTVEIIYLFLPSIHLDIQIWGWKTAFFCIEILNIAEWQQLLGACFIWLTCNHPPESQNLSGMKSLPFSRTASLRPSPLIRRHFAKCWLCIVYLPFFSFAIEKGNILGSRVSRTAPVDWVRYCLSHQTSFLSFVWHKKTRRSSFSFTGLSRRKCKNDVLLAH